MFFYMFFEQYQIFKHDCQQCANKFKTPDGLRAHMNEHTDVERHMYPCDICGDRFTTIHYVKMHKEAQHEHLTHEWSL